MRDRWIHAVMFSVLVTMAAVLVLACAKGGGVTSETIATPGTQPTPRNGFTAADVAKLKWIQGTWRGMDGDKPFFERYRFDGDTMLVETLEDETLAKVTETSRFELKDGEFGHTGSSGRSAASEITDDSITFVPVTGSTNSFKFQRQSADAWKATLDWPAANGKPAGQKVYEMKRVK